VKICANLWLKLFFVSCFDIRIANFSCQKNTKITMQDYASSGLMQHYRLSR